MKHTWTEIEPKAPPLKVQLWEVAYNSADKVANEPQREKRLYSILSLARQSVLPWDKNGRVTV